MRFRYVLLILSLLMCHPCVACRKTVHLNRFAKPGDDVTELLQRLVLNFNTVVIDEGEWLISGEIRLRSNVTIKGVGTDKSVLKRNGKVPLRGGKMFYTERTNTDIYSNHDPNDDFKHEKIKYRNIHFKNLTIDFNRSPKVYTHEELTKRNLYGIALIWTIDASVERCRFIDEMTSKCNNGYPAIVIFQSEGICVKDNLSEGVSFIQTIFSKNCTVEGNCCVSSVGTPIVFISGYEHKCLNNYVGNVFWNVSCIGVNSVSCVVKGNTVNASTGNISCLTLGHESDLFKADNTIAEDNVLHSLGCRSIIIQNGCGIVAKNNECSCVINDDAPEMTSGAIVASGKAKGIYDLQIINNKLIATGNGNRGCITYRGTGRLWIKNNTIIANRGVSILSKENGNVEITNNSINSTDYSITSNSPKLKITRNRMTDGILTNSLDVEISDNQIEYTNHYTYLGTKWEIVVLERNTIRNASGKELSYVFLLNGSEKDEKYDEGKVRISGNVVEVGIVKEIVAVSGNKSAPQLKRIKNIVN